MFFRPRRRLPGAAMLVGIGVAGYAAGKAGRRKAHREQDEEQRPGELECHEAPPAAPAPAVAADIATHGEQLAALPESYPPTAAGPDSAKSRVRDVSAGLMRSTSE